MSGVLRLGNTGAGTGRSTVQASASNDQTFLLPEAGGTLLTSNTSIPGGTITLDGATLNITNGDLNVDSGTLFVDESSNRVGIGRTNPSHKLDLLISQSTVYTAGNFINLAAARLENDSTTTNSFTSLAFRTGSGDNALGFIYTGTPNNAEFVLVTDGGSNGVERLRVDANGDLGIGTDIPSSYSTGYRTVTINGTGTRGAVIDLKTNNTRYAQISNTPTEFTLEANENIPMQFRTGGGLRMAIEADGTVQLNDPLYDTNALLQTDIKNTEAYSPTTVFGAMSVEIQNSVSMGSAIIRYRSQSNNGAAGIWNVGAIPRTNSTGSDFVFQSRTTGGDVYAEAARFDPDGGIKFRNGTSAALNDYQEGSWRGIDVIYLQNPADENDTFPIRGTSFNTQGWYIKTGQVCHVSYRIQAPLNNLISNLNSATYDSWLVRLTLPFDMSYLGSDNPGVARSIMIGTGRLGSGTEVVNVQGRFGDDRAEYFGYGTWGSIRTTLTSAANYQFYFQGSYPASLS